MVHIFGGSQDPLAKLRRGFSANFKSARVELPKTIEARGQLRTAGWTIDYVLDADPEGKPVLDFTAEHRMTNLRYVRVHADGHSELLGTIQETIAYDDTIPGDRERAEQEMQAHNERLAATLKAKGLI
jgi:hypothetical protein